MTRRNFFGVKMTLLLNERKRELLKERALTGDYSFPPFSVTETIDEKTITMTEMIKSIENYSSIDFWSQALWDGMVKSFMHNEFNGNSVIYFKSVEDLVLLLESMQTNQ